MSRLLLEYPWFGLFFLVSLRSPRGVETQFPTPCTTPQALQGQTCCPRWNGSPCGFASGRGVCAPHAARDLPKPVDFRVNWPRAFYNSVCVCSGNYDGFDCGQCLPGWKGAQCMEQHHIERKEVTDLSDDELDTFLASLHLAKQSLSSRYVILTSGDTTVDGNYEFQSASVYDVYVWMHYYSAKSYTESENNAAHRGPAFAFWHRAFLLFMEREMRELTGNEDFYIPYWDWTRTSHCNICTNDFFGGVGQDGYIDSASPFSDWKTICPFQESLGIICQPDSGQPGRLVRNPGKNVEFKTLPIAEDIANIMDEPLFDTPPFNTMSKNSFRNKLEGFDIPQDSRHLNASLHNLVHRYLNGTMSLVPTAANDPIFMLHHCFIDKILEGWLRNQKDTTYPDSDLVHPAQRAKAYMAPFFPLRTNNFYWDVDTNSLGYSYREHSLRMPRAGAVPQAGEEPTPNWHWPVVMVALGLLIVSTGVGLSLKFKHKMCN